MGLCRVELPFLCDRNNLCHSYTALKKHITCYEFTENLINGKHVTLKNMFEINYFEMSIICVTPILKRALQLIAILTMCINSFSLISDSIK